MKKSNWLFLILYIIAIVLFLLAVWKNCRGEEVDWEKLVSYIIVLESGGNPNAISEDGCIGLMQISPMVLEEWNLAQEHTLQQNNGKDDAGKPCSSRIYEIIGTQYERADLFNSSINYKIGTWYLKRIWFHYLPYYKIPQTIDNLLWAYNAGIGNVVKGIKPKETRDYIKKYHKLKKGDKNG